MRKVIALAMLLGCPSRTVTLHDEPLPPPPPQLAARATPDASMAVAVDAPVASARDPVTEITPVKLAGPYLSLADSCTAAAPCGFTDMDENGNEIKPASKPSCDAVLDPSIDVAAHVPDSISKTGGATAMTHRSGGAEIRIGSVICDVPKGRRSERSMYYVFVHRTDGWWRTSAPMFEYNYNDKYCSGAMYIMWNDKPSRTIAGIAAEVGCVTCMKQGQNSSIVELMLRVETTSATPAVFPFLPVGHRHKTEMFPDPSPDLTDAECKPSQSAMSLKETWASEDEVVLDGAMGPSVVTTGGLTIYRVVGDGTIRPGRYRFTR